MKYLFFIFLLVLTACARSNVGNQLEQKEISPEEKIAQVQKLLEVKVVENTQTGSIDSIEPIHTQIETPGEVSTGAITTEKIGLHEPQSGVKEDTSEMQPEKNESLPTQDTQEIPGDTEAFTPDELDVIENTSDAEIDELIDIIFKE